ncbi:MAG: iron-containing alcohol dehydrogenase [Pseudomonadota bacterium]
MQNANWSYPTTIWFGVGRINELDTACKDLSITRPLFVTDRGLADQEITKRTCALIDEQFSASATFMGVDGNPTKDNLDEGVAAFKEGGCDGVIAFGGGSAIDVGKLIAFMPGQTRPVWDFEDIGDWWTRANADAIYPVVAVPTTAGTGSEVGRASVLTDNNSGVKKIIFHPKMQPSIVICDPELTVALPPKITAGTGMDAIAHCLEAYCAPGYHPMGAGIALEGMRLVKENILRAFQHGDDLDARANMMAAAAMGGAALQKGLGAIHALSHPIGAVHHTHHGTTNAVVMAPVLRFNRAAIEEPIERAAKYLGVDGGFDGFVAMVEDLNQSLDIPNGLTALGVTDPDLDELTRKALEDPSVGGNPAPMTYDNTLQLLKDCL